MAKSMIPKLPMYPFVLSAVERVIQVARTPAGPVKKLEDYPVNRLNNALHPGKQFLIVRDIVEHSPDMKTFVLTPDYSAGTTMLAWFAAGSYLSVHYSDENITFTRPYSLSSSPKESLSNHYKLTVKRVAGGIASEYILDHWTVGTKLTASAPLGDFTYEPLRDAKTVVGVAGGSGITPFYSLAQAIADGDEDCSLTLLYGSRTLADAIFSEEIAALSKACDKITLVNVLSDETKDGCEVGFITADLIQKYAPTGEDYSLFLCGPQAMYDFVDKEIPKLGIRQKFVRHELFGEYFHPEKDAAYTGDIAGEYTITAKIAGNEYTVPCKADTTVLRALEAAGIEAPNQCRSGRCGFCHAQLLSGECYTPASVDGRREADRIYGYIHPCCAFPLSDIVIDVPPVAE